MNATKQEMCLFLEVIRVGNPSAAIKTTAIVTSVIHVFTATAALCGNGLMLYIFWHFKGLQTASNLLLASLCITDLLTGMIVQPLSIARRIIEAWGEHNCIVRAVCAYNAFLCIDASIQIVAIVSIDRWIAIKMPFRYPHIGKVERYLKVVAFTWLVWVVFTMMPFIDVFTASHFFIGITVSISINIFVVLVCYAQIFAVVLKHRKRISQQYPQQKIKCVDNKQNNTNTIAIVIFVMLVSYLPLLPLFIIRGTMGDSESIVFILDAWADVFVYANSSVNPFIYWYRSREIRRSIHAVLRRWRILPAPRNLTSSRRTAPASIYSVSLQMRKISPIRILPNRTPSYKS